jgi:hypothetical protein
VASSKLSWTCTPAGLRAALLDKTLLYRASKLDCNVCPLKPLCCPKEPSRKIPRDIHEHARDVARSFAGTEGFETSRRERKKIEMRFAHLKRILKLGRLRLRGPRGAQDEFVLAAIAQNLRRLATLVARPPVKRELPRVQHELDLGKTVVVPADGIGTASPYPTSRLT